GQDHSLDREVRLEFSDGSMQYVSWASEPVQYCVGLQGESWFKPGDVSELEMTNRNPWRHLIGLPVELTWRDVDHQILEVSAGGRSAFLSSCEGSSWW